MSEKSTNVVKGQPKTLKSQESKASGRRLPGRPRDESREAKILEETLRLLGEVGFAGLTVDGVVARARASKATIYRRWATKEELAIAAFDLLPQVQIETSNNLEDDIVRYLMQYGSFAETTSLRTVLPALTSEASRNPELAEKLRQTIIRRRVSGIALVEAAIERGELPAATDAAIAHELFIGPILNRTFFFPDTLNEDEFRKLAKIVIAGLKATGGNG